MKRTVAETIVAIIAEQALLDPADIALDTPLAELGIDSLGLVEAIFAIEEAFDISVPFNANAPSENTFDLTSARSIVSAVEALIDTK
jgi:acyl carrier protein